MSRNRVLMLSLAGVLVAGASGWIAGTQVQSSNEAGASAEAPEASAVTAAVKKMQLASTIVTRGTAQFGESSTVSLAAGAGARLVTRAPEEGGQLADGDAFMEANGEPVFALKGSRPMYRDLGPGDTGEDVRQLEEALERLELAPGAVDGIYDAETAAAVARLYERAGYAAPGHSDAERSEIRSATAAVDQAETALAAARRQLSEGTKPPTAMELLQAENEVRNAEQGVATARSTSEANIRAVEQAVTDMQDALAAAHAKATADDTAARRLVTDMELAVQIAQANLDAARAGDSDTGELNVSLAVLQAEAALRRAENDLADARAALGRLPAESGKAIAAAERALDNARDAVPAAQSAGANTIAGAEASLTLSRLRLSALRAPKTNESLAQAVKDAETALAKAKENLAEIESDAGTKLSAASVVYFVQLPVRIDSVKLKHGDPASGEVMTVSASALVVDASVTIAEAKLLSPGMEVEIEAPDLQISLKGRVSSIAEKPGTDGLDNQHVAVRIEPVDPPENFRDAAVKVTIPVKSTAGAVLVVPVAAVSSSADGSAFVEIEDEDSSRRQVKVAVGLSSQGLVEVTPIDGSIAEGDRAVVGAQ